MTFITRPYYVKRRSLATSNKRDTPARGAATVRETVRGEALGATRGANGPSAFAGDPANYDQQRPKSSPRKKYYQRYLQRQVDRAVERALGSGVAVRNIVKDGAESTLVVSSSLLQSIVERKVEEVLAQRQPAPLTGLAAARERGARWAREEYDSIENISLDRAAADTGIAARIINERRNAWSYYALMREGQMRGFRYPKWQFDANIDRLRQVLAVLRDANAGCWTVHSFMVAPNSALGGLAPRDWIVDPTRDLDRLLQECRARFTSDQGAG